MPTNVVPGIDFSNDPLLQGRLFSYLDTQKSRLGTTNFHQIPINAPKCPFHNFQRDGMMQTLVPTGRANYEPNSLAEAGEDQAARANARRPASPPSPNAERNDGSAKAARARRAVRRPLQPGAAVLSCRRPRTSRRISPRRSCSNCPR
jgi:catalase